METIDVLIIVLLSVAATMMLTAYITLVIVGYVEKKTIRRYLGEDDEYDESESSDGRENGKRNKEDFLRYKCKRDKDSWLLSLSPPLTHGTANKNKEVPKEKLRVVCKKRRPRLLEKSDKNSVATQE